MAERKFSAGTERRAQGYIASLGLSREQLTEQQWDTVRYCTRTERTFWILMLVVGVLGAVATLYHRRSRLPVIMRKEVPSILNALEERGASIEAAQIGEHFGYVFRRSFLTGALHGATAASVVFVVVGLVLQRSKHRQIFKRLILPRC